MLLTSTPTTQSSQAQEPDLHPRIQMLPEHKPGNPAPLPLILSSYDTSTFCFQQKKRITTADIPVPTPAIRPDLVPRRVSPRDRLRQPKISSQENRAVADPHPAHTRKHCRSLPVVQNTHRSGTASSMRQPKTDQCTQHLAQTHSLLLPSNRLRLLLLLLFSLFGCKIFQCVVWRPHRKSRRRRQRISETSQTSQHKRRRRTRHTLTPASYTSSAGPWAMVECRACADVLGSFLSRL